MRQLDEMCMYKEWPWSCCGPHMLTAGYQDRRVRESVQVVHSASIGLRGRLHACVICQTQLSNDKRLSGFDCMAPSASWNSDLNCRLMCAKYGQSKTECRSSPIACVSHNVHRCKCRETLGLASLPCSTSKEWDPIQICINNRNLEIGMGMLRYGSKRNWLGQKNHAKYVHNLAPLDGASLEDTCRPSHTLRC